MMQTVVQSQTVSAGCPTGLGILQLHVGFERGSYGVYTAREVAPAHRIAMLVTMFRGPIFWPRPASAM